MDPIQEQLARFRQGRAARGIATNATDADVFTSPDWQLFTSGQEGWDRGGEGTLWGGNGNSSQADLYPDLQTPAMTTASPAVPRMESPGQGTMWNQSFGFDPSRIAENPSYQFKLSELIKGVNRGMGARGLSFTNQARQELGDRLSGLASTELDNEFGRQLDSYRTNFGTFDADRGFGAARDDAQWGRGVDVWGMNRTNRNDEFDQDYRLSDLVLSRRPRPY